MIDHAALGVLPTLVWTSALAAAGVALGLELRLRSAHDASGLRGTAARVSQLHRVVSTLSALAYLATAWLMLGHAHAGTVNGWDVPAHHGAVQPVDVPLVLTVMLIVALAGLGIVSRRHRQRAMAIEASAMALMLAAMIALT
ncbi:MAG TPA: hypothetical protein VFG92_03575 [Agromyces sp.]|nr:hypothetical protein [Agromyces sp.]